MKVALKKNEKDAIAKFSLLVKKKYGERVKLMKLYGSKSRGDSDEFSDIDIFILVDKKEPEIKDFILNSAYEIDLKYNVLLSIVVYDEKGFNNPISQVTPFINAVVREGLPI